MFVIALILFISMPIIEIVLLLKVGAQIGVLSTVGLVLATAFLGAYLVRQQGLAAISRYRQEVNAGQLPANELIEGVMILLAGAVLVTPGFVTDAIGFSLLVPPLRKKLAQSILSRMVVVSASEFGHAPSSTSKSQATVIEGDYKDGHSNV